MNRLTMTAAQKNRLIEKNLDKKFLFYDFGGFVERFLFVGKKSFSDWWNYWEEDEKRIKQWASPAGPDWDNLLLLDDKPWEWSWWDDQAIEYIKKNYEDNEPGEET